MNARQPARARRARVAGAVVLALVWAQSRPGRANPSGAGSSFLARLWTEAGRQLDAAAAARRAPPVPIAVSWQPRRWGVIDPGAPLLDLTAADVDGDGRAELIGVTTAAVVVIGRGKGGGPVVLARAPLPLAPPAIRPRDPVGAVAVDRSGAAGAPRILARSSEQAEGGLFAFEGGALREVGRVPGFPLCSGVRAELDPGRNYFRAASVDWPELAQPFYAAKCRADLVGADGRGLAARAVLGLSGVLSLRVGLRCGGGDCGGVPERQTLVAGVGSAFAIADVDHDGSPEIIASANSAPGGADRVRVISARSGGMRLLFKLDVAGPVAGLAAGDVDGNGRPEVVVAVRTSPAPRLALWTLN